MDRQLVYPGQIPLETDLLNTNRNVLIAFGVLAADLLGTATVVGGLACSASAPPALTVSVGSGSIYSLQNLDGTAYSSLAADTTHQIVKQGIALDATTLSCAAPATSGFSVNYLIQAAYSDVDDTAVVLPYYNSANPTQAYSGPNNTGASQSTARRGKISLTAKAGIAATTGSQLTPSADSGYVGLWVVTVANGQTTITSGNIALAAGAPFLKSIVSLAALLTVAGPGLIPFDFAQNYAAGTLGWSEKQARIKVTWFTQYVTGGDWVPAIKAAHDACVALGGGFVEFPPGPSYTCKSSMAINPNLVGFELNGVTLDYTSVTTAGFKAYTYAQTIGDANLRQSANRAHPFQNGMLIGPQGAATETCFFGADTTPISGTPWLAGVTLRNISMVNWYRDVVVDAGAFQWVLDNCQSNITGGTTYDASIILNNATNSGENVQLIGGFYGKVYGTLIRNQNPNSSLIARGVSVDYTACLIDAQGGVTDVEGYIENNTDSDYWFKVTGANTLLRVSGELALTGSKTAKEIFYSDSTCVTGGLDIDIAREFAGSINYPLKMIGGTGRAMYRERGAGFATIHPAIGAGTNLLANGAFEGASLTDWSLVGATLPATSTTYAHSGTHSLKLLGAVSSNPGISTSFPCQPGQSFAGELYYRIDNITGTGGTFFVVVMYLDAGGTSLGSSTAASVTTNVGAWTQCLMSQQSPAPAGTRSVSVSISIFGTTSGAPAAYIDDVQLAIV